MRYAKILTEDPGNGPGLRTALFVSGCTHHCVGCFNPETWDFAYGAAFDDSVILHILDTLASPYIDGLTVLGGEPMEPCNQHALLPFLRQVKTQYPQKPIWLFSGYTWDQITGGVAHCELTDELLKLIDVLVDGPFIQEKKNISLRFRGSENQRVLDVRQSRHTGSPVWLSGFA